MALNATFTNRGFEVRKPGILQPVVSFQTLNLTANRSTAIPWGLWLR